MSSAEDKAQKVRLIQERFMRLAEEENLRRAEKWKKIRRNNKITGVALGATALSIYFYSMYAIKQETFLDDFNPPEKISD